MREHMPALNIPPWQAPNKALSDLAAWLRQPLDCFRTPLDGYFADRDLLVGRAAGWVNSFNVAFG
jgi:hypothetical protein